MPTVRRELVVTRARLAVTRNTYVGKGQCLKFARTCAGAPGGVYDADAGWANTVYRHAGTPPAGTFAWWAVGVHGHVAPSLGGGKVASPDIFEVGRVDPVGIDDLDHAWHARYRGWSEDVNGVRAIATPVIVLPPVVSTSGKPHGGSGLEIGQVYGLDSEHQFWSWVERGPGVEALNRFVGLTGDVYTLALKARIKAWAKLAHDQGTTGIRLDGYVDEPTWQAIGRSVRRMEDRS